MTDWNNMPHAIPQEMEPYLMLLCEAGSAENEFQLLVRYQKILRKICDEQIKPRTERAEDGNSKHKT